MFKNTLKSSTLFNFLKNPNQIRKFFVEFYRFNAINRVRLSLFKNSFSLNKVLFTKLFFREINYFNTSNAPFLLKNSRLDSISIKDKYNLFFYFLEKGWTDEATKVISKINKELVNIDYEKVNFAVIHAATSKEDNSLRKFLTLMNRDLKEKFL